MRRLPKLMLLPAAAAGLMAQAIYLPVDAPYAQDLVVATKNAHPELQKLGLHAIPPGQKEYAIIANAIPGKIGKQSSAADLSVVNSDTPTVKKDERGKFFDLCLPLSDAAGRPLGIAVMEIPYTFAKDPDDALAKATAVRDQMQKQIASRAPKCRRPIANGLAITGIASRIAGRFDLTRADMRLSATRWEWFWPRSSPQDPRRFSCGRPIMHTAARCVEIIITATWRPAAH
jgi:hypothetical protein